MVDGEEVITRMTVDVTIRGSGESVTRLGTNISGVVNGKIVEERKKWDPVRVPSQEDGEASRESAAVNVKWRRGIFSCQSIAWK